MQTAELPRDVILQRLCVVEPKDGRPLGELTIRFLASPSGPDGAEATAELSCSYFQRTLSVVMDDEIQAFARLLAVVKAELEAKTGEGYDIYWTCKGDLEFFDFWTFAEKPYRSIPGSVFTAKWAKGQNPDRFTAPSLRVAVDGGGSRVVTYTVDKDGSDRADEMIDADEIGALTPAELCRRLGWLILVRTKGGRKRLGYDL